MIMSMFPRQSIEFRLQRKLGAQDAFGNDTFTEVKEVVNGVLVEQAQTNDEQEPHEEHSTMTVTLDIPKTYSENIENALFEVLTGPLKGRVFKINGDPVGLSYSPLIWNRSCTADEVRQHG